MLVDRVYSFPTDIRSIVQEPTLETLSALKSPSAKALYGNFERDFCYLGNTWDDFKRICGARSLVDNSGSRADLCAAAFRDFDGLIDPSLWRLSESEIIDFFWYRVEAEVNLLKRGTLSPEYEAICKKDNSADICKFYMTQFALDYLTEASPLTRVLPGDFGDLQMAIFKIVDDEYGNGDLNMKHSVLFQATLRSIQMPTQIEAYRDSILDSVYLYMSYVNRICDDKNLFFRFLGFLFVYEACLIYPTQQQGYMLKRIFGPGVDTRYFDFHVEIDQGHGVWVVEKMLVPVIKRYGVEAAREILRGYHETNLLLLLCDLEMTAVAEKRFG